MIKKTHLLIDLDGTLLASKKFKLHSAFIFQSARYMKKNHGLSMRRTIKLLGRLRKALETVDAHMMNEKRAAFVFSQELGVSEAQGLLAMNTMAREAFSHLEPCFRPIPGAKEFIDWASTRYKLVLATNPVWPSDIVLLRLKWSGISADHFQVVTNAETMHACKPHTEYYSELLKQLGIEADAAMMIGDSKKKDLPALKVGIPTFILTKKNRFDALKKLLEAEHA